MTESQTNASRIRKLNATIRYTMWSVFRVAGRLGPARREDVAAEVGILLEQLAAKDVMVRGSYDVSGLRADADVMVWWHAPSADALQQAYGMWRRTALGRHLAPVWSSMAMHRPAEFNQSHLPAFLAGECRFPQIADTVAAVLDRLDPEPLESVEQVLAADAAARALARDALGVAA